MGYLLLLNIRVVEDTARFLYGIYFVDYIPRNDI